MSKKTCERGNHHVMAYAFFFEMPQNQKCSFSVFRLKRLTFEMPHFFMFDLFDMPDFPI